MKLKDLLNEAVSKDSKKELDTIKTIGGDKMLKIAQSLVDKGYDMEDITSFLKKHLKF
jgi:SOS response regulatory protein OraA/RecX